MLTPATIERAFRLAYGRTWIRDAARATGRCEKTIWNWARGKHRPSVRDCGAIRAAVDERLAELAAIRREIFG
jgi:hypothetical protein